MSMMSDITGILYAQSIAVRRKRIERSEGQRRTFVIGWLQARLAAFSRWRQVRRDERFLLEQPDHVLKDMGISRAEIEGAVRGSLRRDQAG